jgi:ATP-dependent protease ClpP protease subunit
MDKLHLYGSVGESFWGEASFSAKDVRKQLEAIRGPVEVHLNSGGGAATDGQAIYAMLKAHPNRVTVVVEGCAASAASLIAMAGAEIVLTDGAWLLLHDPATPWTVGRGTPDDHAKTAQFLDQIAVAYAEIYARRSGNSVDDVRALMRAETLLVGDAAVQMGFADRVDREAEARAVAAFDYRVYATAPKAVRKASERLGAFQGKEAVLAMIAGIPGIAMEKKMNVRVPPPQGGNGGDEPKTKITMTAHQVTRVHSAAAMAGMTAEAANELIGEGKSFELTLDAVNDWWKEQGGPDEPSIGPATARIGVDHRSPRALAERQGDALAAKLAVRMGLKYEPTSGREFMAHSLIDMKVDQMAAIGIRTRGRAEAIQMAGTHTGDDFPLAIGGGLTAIVRRMAQQQDPAIARCAREIEAEDYRTGNAVSLSGSGVPEKIGESGEVKFTTINDEGEVKAVPDDYGMLFRLSNKALVNDSTALDVLADATTQMVKGAMELKRQTLLAPLLANTRAGQTMRDSVALFNAAHGNLAASGAVLSLTTLSTARTAMRRQKDSKGTILNIEPRFLLVPPEIETLAQQVVAQITAAKTADVNPFGGRLDVVAEPGLTSATDWYLVADPAQIDGLLMAYLSGQSAPRVDAKDGWGTLGIEFRLIWAIGAAFHAYQSWYRNPGA